MKFLISLYTKEFKIKKYYLLLLIFYLACSISGIYIWSFVYVPNTFYCENNCLDIIARNMYYFYQTVIVTFCFILAHLIHKKTLSFMALCATFGLATICTYFNVFNISNGFLVGRDSYPFWNETSNNIKIKALFQYAGVYLLFSIVATFYFSMRKKQFRSFDRIVWAWVFAAMCVFSLSAYIVVGKMTFNDHQSALNLKIERILLSDNGFKKWACVQEGFSCLFINENEIFKLSETKNKNVIWSIKKDISSQIESDINENIVIQLKKNISSEIATIVLNKNFGKDMYAVTFGGVILSDGKIFVLIDHDQTAAAVNIYMILTTILMLFFLLVWGGGIYKLKSFHNSRGVI